MGKTNTNASVSGAGNDTLLMDFNIFNQRRTSMLSAVDKLVFDTRPSQMEGKVCGTETIMELMSQWDKVAKTSMNFREFYMGCVDHSLVETADSIYATNEQVANSLNRFGNTNNSFNGSKGIKDSYVDMLANQKAGVIAALHNIANSSAQGIKDSVVDVLANQKAGAIGAIAGAASLSAATPNTQFATDNADALMKIQGLSDAEKKYRLYKYGVRDEEIKEALENGYTLDTLVLTYETFESDQARAFFNKILKQDYDGAFQYLCELNEPEVVVQDKNLMTALSIYSFGIARIDDAGNITDESTKKFESFISAIVNTNGRQKNYSADIFKQMFMYSSIEAVAYNNSVLGKVNSVNEATYKKMTMEARKRMTISNFYATECDALMESSIGMGGTPDASVKISNFTLRELRVINNLTYDRVDSTKETESYVVKAYQNLDAGSINDKKIGTEINSLIKERDELIFDLAEELVKDYTYGLNPFLGYAVKIMYAFNEGANTSVADNCTCAANELLKTSVDEDIRTTVKTGEFIATDVIDYVAGYNKYNKKISDSKEKMKREWFGYCYSYEYEENNYLVGSRYKYDFNDSKYNPIRPEAYVLMREWEKGGINSLIKNDSSMELEPGKTKETLVRDFDEKFEKLIEASSLKDSDKKMDLARKLVYGDPNLDLREVDYGDFTDCICFLDEVYGNIDDDGNYDSIRGLWDARVQQLGGD